LASRPKDVLLPVPKEYISDGFNLAQLAPIVERIGFQAMGEDAVDIAKQLVQLPQQQQTSYPVYRLALKMILLLNDEDDSISSSILQHPLIPPHAIQQAAEALYLLVHARFVSSPRGLDALRRILGNSPVFGRCPRVSCRGTALLPYGSRDDYTSNIIAKHNKRCQRYCPCCGEIWNFWESKTDGCAWGPSLCHLLLLTHGSEIYSTTTTTTTTTNHKSRPMIMGFQIHPATTWGRPLSHQSTATK
jgi:casein kinase II subunit beta